jgi:class 3 adenylate cyclase
MMSVSIAGIPKNRCRTTAAERVGETRAELPFIGDHVVCLSHDQAAEETGRAAAVASDGVNIAARLEGIAEPGGICLSDDAFRQVRGKVEAEFADLGEQTLKNIARPLRFYASVRHRRPGSQ